MILTNGKSLKVSTHNSLSLASCDGDFFLLFLIFFTNFSLLLLVLLLHDSHCSNASEMKLKIFFLFFLLVLELEINTSNATVCYFSPHFLFFFYTRFFSFLLNLPSFFLLAPHNCNFCLFYIP